MASTEGKAMMKFYKFHGDGLALGSVVVVMAKRVDQATRIAKKWASENGVDPETLELTNQEIVELPSVVYGWNGDY